MARRDIWPISNTRFPEEQCNQKVPSCVLPSSFPFVGVSRWKRSLCRGANLLCQPRYSTRKDVIPFLPFSLSPCTTLSLVPVELRSTETGAASFVPWMQTETHRTRLNDKCFEVISRHDNSHYSLTARIFRGIERYTIGWKLLHGHGSFCIVDGITDCLFITEWFVVNYFCPRLTGDFFFIVQVAKVVIE